MEGDSPVIEHNGTWYNKLQEDYYDLCEKSDNVLEMQQAELSSGKVEAETKVDPEELKLRQNKKNKLIKCLTKLKQKLAKLRSLLRVLKSKLKIFLLGH